MQLFSSGDNDNNSQITIISNKFAIFKKIKIAKILIIVQTFLCVTSLSILFTKATKFIYDIKRKLQLTTNVDLGIHVTPFPKRVNISKSFCSLLDDEDDENLPLVLDDEEDVSCDVESLFTNIPIKDTIEHIIEQIYTHKKLKPICSELIFKRLLLKLATECTCIFNHKFYKQIDGCTMGGPLSVTFSDIYMIKMESEIVISQKPLFYRRYVDDIYSTRKSLSMITCLKS